PDFFFSSRGRHTRFSRDWSSDVCSSDLQPHLAAIARHAGITLTADDWQDAYDIPLLANIQPAGEYLCESFHRAGGVPAVMWELQQKGLLHDQCLTISGHTLAEALQHRETCDRAVI